MKTPDTTPNQIVALIGAVVGLLVAYGLVDNDHAQSLTAAASIIVPTGLLLADSIIRHGRAKIVAPAPQIQVIAADTPAALHAVETQGADLDEPADDEPTVRE